MKITNPTNVSNNCAAPASQRRASNEPKPGAASRFNSVALRARARLSGLRSAEEGFIRIHGGGDGQRRGEQFANTTGQEARHVDEADDHDQPEDQPPVTVDLFP